MSQPASHSENQAAAWVGGQHQGTLDTYVLDYLHRRGFRKTAAAFSSEAGVPLESPVPFDAPQGLLFEWWEAFWLIFLASSGKVMNRNATVYVDAIKNRRTAQQLHPAHQSMPPPQQPVHVRGPPQPPPGYAPANGHPPPQGLPNGVVAPAGQPHALRNPRQPSLPAQQQQQQPPPSQQQQQAAPSGYTPQAQYAAAHAQYQQMQETTQRQQGGAPPRNQQQAEQLAREQAMRAHQFQQHQQYAQQQHQLAAAQHAQQQQQHQHQQQLQQQQQQHQAGSSGRPQEHGAGMNRAYIDQCIAACGFAGKTLEQLTAAESQTVTSFYRQALRQQEAQQRMEMYGQQQQPAYPPGIDPPHDYIAASPGTYPPGYGSPAAQSSAPQPGQPGVPFATTRSARKLQQQAANAGSPNPRTSIVATPVNAPTPPTPDIAHMPAPSPRGRKRPRVDAPTPGSTANNAPTPSGSVYEHGQTPQQMAASPAPMHAPSPRNSHIPPAGEGATYGMMAADEVLARVPVRHDSMLLQHSSHSGGDGGQPNGYATVNGHLAADNANGPSGPASPAARGSPLAHDATLSLSQPADTSQDVGEHHRARTTTFGSNSGGGMPNGTGDFDASFNGSFEDLGASFDIDRFLDPSAFS